MAEDGLCRREMTTADSCVDYKIQFGDDEIRDPVEYGEETGEHRTADSVCHDCGISPGGIHHPGCDWAECPRCGGQLLGHEIGIPRDCSPVKRYVLVRERYYDAGDRTVYEVDHSPTDINSGP